MALWQKLGHRLCEELSFMNSRCYYSSKVDWDKIRPMILERIQNRAKDYPVRSMIPVAHDVIQARSLLYNGVSNLIKSIPIKACKFCTEVYIGEKGHLIETCPGYKRRSKNQVHEWIDGSLDDILVPVEAFHIQNYQNVIKHDQRFDFDRVPAVLELCAQAGADIFDENLRSRIWSPDRDGSSGVAPDANIFDENLRSGIWSPDRDGSSGVAPDANIFDENLRSRILSPYRNGSSGVSSDELKSLAIRTLEAWENLRSGVQRLLLVYPAKVCKHCSEVHVGPSGHKARLCGVFKYETWRGGHLWKRAEVNDLVPPKIVWRRRKHDPPVLLDRGRDFYGHAPAVVELCLQAGAIVPPKYSCMMKVMGLAPPR